MELFELKANIRETTGKCAARVLRRNQTVPAILYGLGNDPVKVEVLIPNLELAFKHSDISQVLVNIAVMDGDKEIKKCPAMLKDIQLEPVSKEMLHADFLEIDLNKPVHINVPVHTVGKAKGVELGGTLQVIRRELEILCMPLEIPESISLDVSDLDMGDSIHVKEIKIEGIEIPADVNFTVITVVGAKAVEGEDEEELDQADVAEEAAE